VIASELAAPEAPAEPSAVTVGCTRELAAIVPMVCGSGVPENVPILTLVNVTLPAACKLHLDPLLNFKSRSGVRGKHRCDRPEAATLLSTEALGFSSDASVRC
jgi:hypothetical protein